MDEVERITQAFLVDLPIGVRKTGQQYALFFEEELALMIEKDSIRGPLRHPTRWYGFYGAKKTPDRTDILPSAWEEFERLLYHRKTASAVVQIVYGLQMNPTDIRPSYDRAIVKEKAIPKALPKMIIPEVNKMAKSTSTTRLLEAQQRADIANKGSWEEYLRDISIRWECKSDLCRCRNKGGICWINQGIHYRIARNWLNLWARKCKSGDEDGVSVQNPPLQIKHESAAMSLKEVERERHMRSKQEEKKA